MIDMSYDREIAKPRRRYRVLFGQGGCFNEFKLAIAAERCFHVVTIELSNMTD